MAGSEGTGPAAARLSLARWAGQQMQEHPVVCLGWVCVLRLCCSLPCVCHFVGDLAWVAAPAAEQRGPGTCVTM